MAFFQGLGIILFVALVLGASWYIRTKKLWR
jgi:hypothetical protein